MNKRLREILERKNAIRVELRGDGQLTKEQLDGFDNELRELEEEEQEIRKRYELADKIESGAAESRKVETPADEEKRESEDVEMEKRGQDLLENRAIMVSSGDIVLPHHDSANIKGTFNQVSTLVDRVQSTPLEGGESYRVPFEIQHGEGNYTAEGQPYFDVDQEFGYANITKSKITAYTEISEETLKLPRAQYATRVIDGVRKAVRKKITKEILAGDGATNHFAGIFSTAAAAINPATDVEIDDINEDTLDDIIYSYGGDEDVESESVLVLNKDDLRKFAKLRIGTDNRKAYEVVHNGNTGTINGVQYIINSAAKSTELAAEGEYVMAYGPVLNYEMGVFSPLEVQRSTDYKFKEGMVAYRGSVFAGGNVVAHNGFLRVKKAIPTP
ncbi:phage major capsid protein [Jeotgalibacillus aurantiacus]|uniref:phage major capsid protein n=1 Tax=Jeotgalibacillus aurantiacus TaxID=2763266 RepID=UPI001D0A9ACD|nr:phage major capsid protein [Jeotgalibacillus aurantiacus]